MRADVLSSLLAEQGTVVLDGALATELEARGADLSHPLWSARLLVEAPGHIRTLHADYFRAGADVAITATYQASFEGLAAYGIAHAEATRLMRRAVELACEARDDVWGDPAFRRARVRPLVAASVGPYGAARADGSEYTGAYDVGVAELVDWHRERFAILAQSGADLLACETLPCLAEVDALLQLLGDTPGARAWISCQARDGEHLASGEPFAAAVARAAAHPQVVAVGVNCTAPEHVAALVATAAAITAMPVLAYPNSGERWDAAARCWVPASAGASLAAMAQAWRTAGATILGGCCRTAPDDIRALRAALLH